MSLLAQFREIWVVDLEFLALPGARNSPVCMVAIELRSGRCLRIWMDELARMIQPPFDVGPGTLVVAFYASADLGCFLALGWPMPAHVLDLYVEFRCLMNGLSVPSGYQWGAFLAWMKKRHPKTEVLSDITSSIAATYLEHIEKRLSSNSYNKHVDTLRRTFRILMKEKQVVTSDPWAGVQHKRANGNRRNAFTVEDAKTIISKARGWMKSLWLVGFYTGQRFCDCVFLKWEQVDFANGLLVITPRKTRNSSGLVVELPMHAELLHHLRELHTARGRRKSPYVIPRAVAEYQHNRQELAITLREFLEGCGFQVHKEGTGGETGVRAVPILGFHSCRHTFVSICRNNGVPDSVIQAIVGNSYLLYSHVDRCSKQKAVDKLPWLGEQLAAPAGQGTATVELDSLNYDELIERQQALKAEIERRLVRESPLKLVHG